ncbi:magnesium transporter CorA family protein [Phenylobacterium immobile]|uniref:magnesium transporter CorA family protein n=1 Tax=Phenylobacterium immobile TaxID=21 RepID=UPI000AF03156|nr:magnesium transporter CorA family protein [Phenylobacterium immobile]
MHNLLRRGASAFEAFAPGEGWPLPADTVWIDLKSPTREEELAIERALGFDLPTRDEMAQLEPSSRFYQEAGVTFMTATLLARRADQIPTGEPVTFVLARGVLVTIRYEDLRAFTIFTERAPHSALDSGPAVLLELLDAVVERLAQILDQLDDQLEEASAAIFQRPEGGDFRPLLTTLARAQSIASLARSSLVSLGRLAGFAELAGDIARDPECRAHLDSIQNDAKSLTEHAGHQASHITFLLDAALGLINIEQNGIIKIFSVMAVIFMPPTLVASIYGMNFHRMPELSWAFGYPMALGLMLLAALVPVVWFKKRGWF